ncbi:phosphoenolpyruvate carboxylase [Dongshaea marina]|uniref:phosphoenolpyruvate carboxylase n=1 Tax=Dongshaea marina TaxID=2047966 RepID=UPI000D3ED440|nr:phosphoenolpyruvate carboxylase [Dongshaea marina]
MSDNIAQAGVKFLRQLARHGDLLMRAYQNGTLDETAEDPKVIEKLLDARVLYRPEEQAEIRLASALRSILEEGLRDERSRQITTNVGATLATLRTLTKHYREARQSCDFAASESYLDDLSEEVYALTEGLHRSIRLLWGRINNEFGYVGTINAKIRENELAQSQVSELLDGLELLRFDELSELAGDERELRRLLVVSLQHTLVDCGQELSVVQGRLLELLGRFREIRGRTRLLKGWLLYNAQHSKYSPLNHATHKQLPMLLNQAKPILTAASVDVTCQEHEHQLMHLAGEIRSIHRHHLLQQQVEEPTLLTLEATDEFELTDSPLKQAVERYFCEVIDSGERLSALEYYQQQGLEWDTECWLYQVLGAYEGMPKEQREYFELEHLGHENPHFSGNYVIEDLQLWLA